jgi:endonuclease/exonuclease/phosphatase family metal-dependent hydrolase
MRTVTRLLPFLALAALAACSEQNPLAPRSAISLNNSADHGGRSVSVMTRNMYIGADVDAVMTALATPDPNDDLPALMVALQTLQHTDFTTRVEAMADEIARNRPDVVGLQEVYELTVIPAWLGLPGDPIQIDFLAALQAALAAEHVHYEVAARNTSTDATLAGGAVHIVDHDVLLVDSRRVALTGAPVETVYAANIGEVVPGLTLLRGYVARKATVDGVPTLLVNTHLESGDDPQIAGLRALQAGELAAFIGSEPSVVLTGDFNDVPGSMMYGVLSSSQLADTWGVLEPRDPGFSCCQAPDLSNRRSLLNQRIDMIWTRGFARPSGKVAGEIRLVSALPNARVRGPFGLIWPSDHAGVFATVDVPQPSIRH